MENLEEIILGIALNLEFDDCAIVNIDEIDKIERERFDEWLKNGYNAEMKYLETKKDIRFNPTLLLDNAQTAVVVLKKLKKGVQNNENKLARTKRQKEDYHKSIRRNLNILAEKILELSPDVNTRICVDSAPILEKYWAKNAGLGFIGYNTLFISDKLGSFCNIGILLIDKKLSNPISCKAAYEEKISKFEKVCEKCKRCLQACPHGALVAPFTINCNKCISYQNQYRTIEGFDYCGWVKGCDICQEVCPFNKYQ